MCCRFSPIKQQLRVGVRPRGVSGEHTSSTQAYQEHIPVLLREVLASFKGHHIRVVVDGTLGAGGHALNILRQHPEIERYIGVDRDPQALAISQASLAEFKHKVAFVRGDFVDIPQILAGGGKDGEHSEATGFGLSEPVGEGEVGAILLDLGVSSMQLDNAEKGFSFQREGPLDMRMDPRHDTTAADIVNSWTEEELGRLFRDYGEEKRWRKLAGAIVRKRNNLQLLRGIGFRTTTELAQVIANNSPPQWVKNRKMPKKSKTASSGKSKSIHPATRVFQALRCEVNKELDVVANVIPTITSFLSPEGGKLAIISFHSLEDRIVKRSFLRAVAESKKNYSAAAADARGTRLQIVTKKPIMVSEEEITANPRSRSAKLRVLVKGE